VPNESLDACHSRRLREILVSFRAQDRFRQAEVQHLHPPFGRDLNIGRLQIAVNDAVVVRGS
jgi:hypothetical protein